MLNAQRGRRANFWFWLKMSLMRMFNVFRYPMRSTTNSLIIILLFFFSRKLRQLRNPGQSSGWSSPNFLRRLFSAEPTDAADSILMLDFSDNHFNTALENLLIKLSEVVFSLIGGF